MEERLIRDYVEHTNYPVDKGSKISNIMICGDVVQFTVDSAWHAYPELCEIELNSQRAIPFATNGKPSKHNNRVAVLYNFTRSRKKIKPLLITRN